MKSKLRTVMLVVLCLAVALTVYKSFFASPALQVGMTRDQAIAKLRRANAADMLRLSISSRAAVVPASSKIKGPTAQDIVEYQRLNAILESKSYSEENFETYWYLPTVGRFETHFQDGKLESIKRWVGNKSEMPKRLTLELRPDDPNEMAGPSFVQ